MTVPGPGPTPHPAAAGPPPLTSEQLLAWVERRRRFRHKVKIVVVALLAAGVAALAVGWTLFNRQLLAMGHLGGIGFSVDWDFGLHNLSTGGTTGVVYRPRWYPGDAVTDRDFEQLKSLNHLVSLDLSDLDRCGDDDLAVVATLGELEDLQLNRMAPTNRGQFVRVFLTDRVLDHVAGLTRLKGLGLSGNRISDEGLAKLANLQALETLDLSETPITDAGLSALVGLKGLKTLRVEDTKVTRQGIARFQQVRPGVEVIFQSLPMEPGVTTR